MNTNRPLCLSIGGLDPSGGAGIIADLHAFHAFGCDAAAVVTSITYQNSEGFFGADHQTAATVARQLDAVLNERRDPIVKTGMLPTAEIVDAVGDRLGRYDAILIIDPVLRSTSGHELISTEAQASMINRLFPIAALVTPNISEAERLTGQKISSDEDAAAAANLFLKMGARAVLIKGGHADPPMVKGRDLLFTNDGAQIFDATVVNVEMRGTGCTLASAIAANLALGLGLAQAVRSAKDFLSRLLIELPDAN